MCFRAVETNDTDAAFDQETQKPGDFGGGQRQAREIQNGRPVHEKVGRRPAPAIELVEPVVHRRSWGQHEGDERNTSKADGLPRSNSTSAGQGFPLSSARFLSMG